MADNVLSGNSVPTAADLATYSGDAGQAVQLVKPVHVTGAEGSKTVVDITTTDGHVKTVSSRSASGVIDAATELVEIDTTGMTLVTVSIIETAFTGTVSLRAHWGNATNWSNLSAWDFYNGSLVPNSGDLPLTGDNSIYLASTAGASSVWVYASALSAGSIAVDMVAHVTGEDPLQRWEAAFSAGDGHTGVGGWADLYGNIVIPQSAPSFFNGTTWDRMRGTTANGLDVDVTRLPADINSGAVNKLYVEPADDNDFTANFTSHDQPDGLGGRTKIGGVARATAPTDVSANGDAVDAWYLRNGAAATVVTAAGALIGGDAANGLDVDVTRLPALVAGTAYVGKVRLTDGTLDTTLVDETGTNAVDVLGVGGGTPHDSVDSGNPLKVGIKAVNAFPTAVANNDRANGIGDLFGRQMVTHIDPAQQVWKSYNDTSSRAAGSAQVVWDPTAGKKIAITSYVVSAYGTTAGRIFLFFADDADLTYTAGTDQPLLVASYAPSTSSKPGTVWTGNVPIFCVTADRRLHYQNDAAISVDVTIYGYEW